MDLLSESVSRCKLCVCPLLYNFIPAWSCFTAESDFITEKETWNSGNEDSAEPQPKLN